MAISATNSFGTRDKLNVGAQSFDIHRLEHLERQSHDSMTRLPFSLRILLENLLRNEDGRFVHREDIQALANWRPGAAEKRDCLHAGASTTARFYRRAGSR
jgi:aconitate hydratase